jgi:nitroreductase
MSDRKKETFTNQRRQDMQFHTPVTDIIRRRKSIRSYLDRPVEEEKREALNQFLSSNTTGPFGTKSRFLFITATPEDRKALRGLITYGVIKNPAGFIIGAVEKKPHHLEDFGYLMEQNILMATDLGLGTCWLGGTYNSSGFARKMALQPHEIIPAVASVGYAVPRLSPVDSLIRMSSGANRRKSWSTLFFQDQQALSTNDAGRYATPLEMLRLAPSASNFQPWRIVRAAHTQTFHFYLKRTPAVKQIAAFKADLQLVDMGIAMCHFALAAGEEGLKGRWEIHDPLLKGDVGKMDYIATWVGGQ